MVVVGMEVGGGVEIVVCEEVMVVEEPAEEEGETKDDAMLGEVVLALPALDDDSVILAVLVGLEEVEV